MYTVHGLVRNPRFVRWAMRIDRMPAWGWLLLQAAALLPAWLWMARRMADGSDDPLGLLALAGMGVLVAVHRRHLRGTPALTWMGLALLLTLAATLARGGLAAWPALFTSLLAVLAMAAALLAFLPRQVAAAPVLGLAVLALPLLSSLQFYAGYPLRVATAEATRWLLAPAYHVWREGSTLVVDGRQIIVDAPCSGVQMVWLGYFTAFAVALWARQNDRTVLTRLPFVGMLVLTGNILRNSVLVAAEGAGMPLPGWGHEAVGLAVLAAVCGAIAALMHRPAPFFLPVVQPRGASYAHPA